MTLKVPYNFVPLNEKVVTPYWIDHISHDIPFRDGRSGTLKLTLTAESPIFVKRGEAKSMTQKNTDSKGAQIDPYEFEKDAAGKYFIPGSSLRGMVRSVVETLSFGRMLGRVSERRYAVRDLSNSKLYTDHFKPGGNDPLQCGWLKKEGDDYFIYGCGEPGRISHRTIEQYTGVPMEKFFTRGTREYRRSEKEQKSAQFKYDLFKKHGQQHFLEQEHSFVRAPNDEEKDTTKDKRKIFVFTDDKEQSPGKLVFTGQPDGRNNNRTPPTGKRLEFIFFETSLENKVLVSEEVMDDFRFAYFNHRPKTEQSDDYMERNKQLEGGDPIPVFYKFKELKNGRPYGVKHFGLSYLYKLPYKYTVEDSIKNYQTDKDGNTNADGRDLADAIFGMVGESKNASTADFLKGRVQFSHAKMKGETKKMEEEKVILGEPRASFYPTYIRQETDENGTVNSYKTFMDKEGQIAGRKRYPVLAYGTRNTNFEGINADSPLITKFLPLDKGTTFTCELSYHNLRALELGALLSALTLHGTDRSRHQVGMAKPLGFGKIKVSIAEMPDEKQQELMLRYEAYMDQELGGPDAWRTSPQVTELVTLTNPVNKLNSDVLKGAYPYNALDDFRALKGNKYKRGEGLRLHSEIIGGSSKVGLSNIVAEKINYSKEISSDREVFLCKGVFNMKTQVSNIHTDLKHAIEAKIVELEQHEKDLKRRIELNRSAAIAQRLAAEKASKKVSAQSARDTAAVQKAERALTRGPEYVNVLIGRERDYWKNLASVVSDYLTDIEPIYNSTKDGGAMPEQWQEELIDKMKIVHAKQPTKVWKKKLVEKQSTAEIWLGKSTAESIMSSL
jgi:CRISPR-associated protein (TIGR03986 family)